MKTLLLLALLTLPLFPQTPILINAGGLGDSGFSGVTTAYVIPQTNGTMRYGQSFAYDFTLAPGWYTLQLTFIETTVTAPGQRVFSVFANDQPIAWNLDVFASAGMLTPVSRSALINVTGATLHVAFVASVRNAVICRISVIPSDLGGTAAATPAGWTVDDYIVSPNNDTVFRLSTTPGLNTATIGSPMPLVFVNGSLRTPSPIAQILNGVNTMPTRDYSVLGNTLTFSAPLAQGDHVRVVYQ